jgi:hypothetical protein
MNRRLLEVFGSTELADDGGGVLVLGIHGAVEAADIRGGEFAGEIGKGGAELGELHEGRLADDGDGVVRREVVEIVREGHEPEGVDEAVGGVAGDDVHLMIDESAVDEAEVHDFGRFGKVETVAGAEPGEAVGALEEFVTDAGAPLGGERGKVRERLEVEILGIVAADHHGEGVLETKGLCDFEAEALGVELLDAGKDGSGVVAGG